MFFSHNESSSNSNIKTDAYIAGISPLGFFIAHNLQKKGFNVTFLDSPTRISKFEGLDIIFKEQRLLQNQRVNFKYSFEMTDTPKFLFISDLFANTTIPLLTPSKVKNTLVINFSLENSPQELKEILKTPVIQSYFLGYLHQEKNHLSVLSSDNTMLVDIDETDAQAFKIKELFADSKITVLTSDKKRTNFWKFFAPFIISNLLTSSRSKNFYSLCKNESERQNIDICINEIISLAADEKINLERSEILINLYNIPSGYTTLLQNNTSPHIIDVLSSLLGRDMHNKAPFLYSLLREIYNKY